MSYANMIMYGAVLPSIKSKKDGKGGTDGGQEFVKADDPSNKEKVRQFLASIE